MKQNLSSYGTIIPMVVLPVVLAALAIESLVSARPQSNATGFAAFMLLILVQVPFFSWRLCFASTDGRRLRLRSLRGSDEIDLSEIKDVEAISRSRNPRINVTFRTGSRLGDKIMILPPYDFRS